MIWIFLFLFMGPPKKKINETSQIYTKHQLTHVDQVGLFKNLINKQLITNGFIFFFSFQLSREPNRDKRFGVAACFFLSLSLSLCGICLVVNFYQWVRKERNKSKPIINHTWGPKINNDQYLLIADHSYKQRLFCFAFQFLPRFKDSGKLKFPGKVKSKENENVRRPVRESINMFKLLKDPNRGKPEIGKI